MMEKYSYLICLFIKKTSNRKLFNQKGFTLIEIIVSLAILGMIVITFTTLFSRGFINIYSLGNRGVGLYQAQEAMERALSGDTKETIMNDMNNIKVEITETDMNYQGSPIEGERIVITYDDGNHKITLASFKPNP